MITNHWNPHSTEKWAEAIGLARVPLFGAGCSKKVKADLAVLLDGRRSSLAVYSSETGAAEELRDSDVLSWSWSANLRHSFIVSQHAVTYRRWVQRGRRSLINAHATRRQSGPSHLDS